MATFTVVYDACVLYPAPLRDLLMHLATAELFRARWTEHIHEEWIRNLVKAGRDATKLQRTRELMDRAVPDCLIKGYEPLIESLVLPDPDDRHVLAAAIAGKADLIVTTNLADFPAATLKAYGVEAQHPDDFVVSMFDLSEARVCEAVKRQRANLKHPPVDAEQFLETLARQRLPQTVERLRPFLSLI